VKAIGFNGKVSVVMYQDMHKVSSDAFVLFRTISFDSPVLWRNGQCAHFYVNYCFSARFDNI